MFQNLSEHLNTVLWRPEFEVPFESAFYNLYFKSSRQIGLDEDDFFSNKTWNEVIEYMYQNVKLIAPSIDIDLIVTFSQLLKRTEIWKTFYYRYGASKLESVLKKCDLFMMWGKSTYISLCNKQNSLERKYPQKSYRDICVETVLVQGNGYKFDHSIRWYRVLYKVNEILRRKSKLISINSVEELFSDLKKINVGQEIHGNEAMLKNEMKNRELARLVAGIPKSGTCCKYLNEKIPKKDDIVPTNSVVIVVKTALNEYIPKRIFGFKSNFKHYLQNIEQIIRFGKNQQVTLGFLMKGVIPERTHLWKKNLLAKLAVWILENYVMKLLKVFFYVTDADKGTQLLFIKKSFWIKFERAAVLEMAENDQLVAATAPRPSLVKRIRFLPKLTGIGYRPVILKSDYDVKYVEQYEVCQSLLKQIIYSKSNSSFQPVASLHRHWKDFVNNKSSKTKSFFVKTDIKDAYGSIVHVKLKSILNEWFQEIPKDLILMRFEYLNQWGEIKCSDTFTNLPEPSIRSKKIKYLPGYDRKFRRDDLKALIFFYIDNIFLRAQCSSTIYRLEKGLHQGGKLSAALCEIYFIAMDFQYQLCANSKDEIVLRAVDDYIFVSQSETRVAEFLNKMLQGFPDYGVTIQLEKTFSNFQQEPRIMNNNVIQEPLVKFFGFNLDVEKGYIYPNMDKYETGNFYDLLPFKKLQKRILFDKLGYVFSLKLQKLVLDSSYQPKRVVFNNICTAATVMCLKFIAATHYLKVARIHAEESFIIEALTNSVNKIAENCAHKGKPTLTYLIAKKLCLLSFIKIMKKKACFREITIILEKQARYIPIKKYCSKKTIKMMKTVTKKSNPSFAKRIK